jgi:hypothetical protein
VKPFQERVIAEKKELDERRERLLDFIESEGFTSVGGEEAARLGDQLEVMRRYSAILAERIGNFKGGDPVKV